MSKTAEKPTHMYHNEIQQMMFVFGEVQDALDETCMLVEDIVKKQIISLISESVLHSQKRGSRYLAPEDLIFLIRHDRTKVNRLRSFLSWKDVRKNVKDKGAAPAIDEDLIEEDNNNNNSPDKGVKIKKMSIKFSWDHMNQYSSILEEDEDDDADEEEREAYEDQINRLRVADQLTQGMTKEEYMHYSDCRQASFTYKKLKRFREWCEMGKFYDAKGSSDIIDSLGFLCHEAVGKITETALLVKEKEDESGRYLDKKDSHTIGLFRKPAGERMPLLPRHIQEAYRLLQMRTNALHNFKGSSQRRPIILI